MKNFDNIQWLSLANTIVSLTTAFVLGSLIGFERQVRQRTAGLRTNVLVSVGAAIFVDLAFRIGGADGGARVISYVVSGVGFLGAGAIMREGGSIRGLNTAATLWGSAAIGACAGASMMFEAIMAALFVLAANTLLRPVVSYVNRQPVEPHQTEVSTVIHLITGAGQQQQALARLEEVLEAEQLPLSELKIDQFGDADVEIEATLAEASIQDKDLDRVAAILAASPAIRQAFWSANTL
ncbi:MgtC/SapB family protein [Bordetella avium]|uniref:MgtC/SapB family protein n=1 Tax=Bordetella avium TaxID=521 RepID=UPI000E0B5557|nr:MgtC/SapB family protein [Bordetella avium]AZY49164.1 methyltransferase [Bordetella avium]AZY52521.1 methyltransferase [Bordetella avium]RIQ12312.1 MgtC/SapB family protein [Bordetella avium]RIQ19315.1 MgtC/SapB family protein [Bordetella avium]RIQ33483.1 MgtC/SapB family protein [Bordetella avium]